ncbi:MAG: succinate dehydrogenase [Planctomycetes bacterium]|nr:succinate dehydrogenase [Planctomycetota bacterium]
MSQAGTLDQTGGRQSQDGFGVTARRDAWWVGPAFTAIGLSAFLIYGTWAAWQSSHFEIRKNVAGKVDWKGTQEAAPYLSPFYSPLIYDPQSHHAIIKGDLRPSWLPGWFPFSAAFLILAFPGLFRFTCYYYRKAYYRAMWADPPACAVGEPRKSYWGENRWPLILQNSHRYFMYFAVLFLVILGWDALKAFWWPTDRAGNFLDGGHQLGIGLGTLIMVANVCLLAGFTFGCNSFRHLVGGRLDCFSCPNNIAKLRPSYKLWRFSTLFNENHMQWAWLSLFSVGFTDVYIRMCALGIWTDLRIL